VYRNQKGDIARLDISKMSLTYPTGDVRFSDCSTVDEVCWTSDDARIEVPTHCKTEVSIPQYIMSPGRLKFLSLEGLSGNIFKFDSNTNRFGYAYNPDRGLVQLIIIPRSQKLDVSTAGEKIIPYLYRITGASAPFSCKR
jgi:hypothetical protein